MKYLGGKYKIRKEIGDLIRYYKRDRAYYLEPFVGSAWVLSQTADLGIPRIASDYNKYMIYLWQGLQNGWVPPDEHSEEEHAYIKNNYKTMGADPLIAFSQVGCSFAGIWGGGYARDRRNSSNFALSTKKSLLKKLPYIITAKFEYHSYIDYRPQNAIVYCDPPYANTSGYTAAGKFDSDMFWKVMRIWSRNNTVLISEYNAPDDFDIVWEGTSRMGLRNKNNEKELRIERVYKYNRWEN